MESEEKPEMPKKFKATDAVAAKKMPVKSKVAPAKVAKLKGKKTGAPKGTGAVKVLKSTVVYQGSLFRVTQDELIEPSGKENVRDVVRHNRSEERRVGKECR